MHNMWSIISFIVLMGMGFLFLYINDKMDKKDS
jgi:hypothetical protein